MPHTSHKKKKQQQQFLSRNKKGEIQSDDGWTRVVRSDRACLIKTSNPTSQIQINEAPSDPTYSGHLDEGCTQAIIPPRPAEPPDGASLQKALNHYQKCASTFQASDTWKELQKTFISRIFNPKYLPITNCICLGLSSPTGLLPSGADRRHTSMTQLAAFKTIIDLLTQQQQQQQGIPLAAFAQDPIFNALDTELLSHLHITVVHHPAAFHLISRRSFTFCPGAEPFVLRGALSRSPALHLGSGALETVRGDEHIWRASEETRSRDQQLQLKQEERDEVGEKSVASQDAEILQRFKKGKASVRLPDYEPHDYSLYDMYLFWRVEEGEEEEEDR